MRGIREQPGPRRVDDGDRDAGVHGGEPEQDVRPRLVGRNRLVQTRKEAPGFEGGSRRLHRVEEREAGGDIDWDALPASVVAWVRVPGTTVDYLIVQGWPESPDFYLTHDAGGERSVWGAPCIDAGCAQGVDSPLVIVYGRYMSDGTMFAPLAQYSSRAFAEAHRTICAYTRDKEIELEVFAVDVVDASSEDKRTDFADMAALGSYLGDKLSRCEIILEEPKDVAQAWAFVTCSYQTSNSRTVVYAKEVKGWDSRPSE